MFTLLKKIFLFTTILILCVLFCGCGNSESKDTSHNPSENCNSQCEHNISQTQDAPLDEFNKNAAVKPPAKKLKRILFVYTDDHLYEREERIFKAFSQVLANSPYRTEYDSFEFHAQTNKDNKILDSDIALLQNILNTSQYDLIVLANNPASDVFLEQQVKIPSATPVIFAAYHGNLEDKIPPDMNATGIITPSVGVMNVELALAIKPEFDKIMIISGNTAGAKIQQDQFFSALSTHLREKIIICSGTDTSIDELKKQISELDSNSVIYFSTWSSPDEKSKDIPDTLLPQIRALTSSLILGRYEFYKKHGVDGGVMVSSLNQGLRAGGIACRIFDGESLRSIPVTTSSYFTELDYSAIKSHGIQPSHIPSNVHISNIPVSPFQRYIHVFVFIFIILLISIAVLLYILKRRAWFIQNERFFSSCLKKISLEQDFEKTCSFLLEEIGRVTHADRIRLFQYFPEKSSVEAIRKWSLEPEAEDTTMSFSTNTEEFRRIVSILLEQGFLRIDTAGSEFEVHVQYLKSFNIKTVLLFGITIEEKIWGAIGISYKNGKHNSFGKTILSQALAGANLFSIACHRKKQQDKLRDTLFLYQQIFDSLPMPITLQDLDYNILKCNPCVQNFISANTEHHKKCYKRICMEDSPPDDCPVTSVIKSGREITLERYYEGHLMQVQAVPIFDHTGNMKYVLEASHDITERENQKKILQRKNVLLSALNKQSVAIKECLETLLLTPDFNSALTKVIETLTSFDNITAGAIYKYDAINDLFRIFLGSDKKNNTPDAPPLPEQIRKSDSPAEYSNLLKIGKIVQKCPSDLHIDELNPMQSYMRKRNINRIVTQTLNSQGKLWGSFGIEYNDADLEPELAHELEENFMRLLSDISKILELIIEREHNNDLYVKMEKEKEVIWNLMPIPILLFDREIKTLRVSPEMERLLDRPQEKIIGIPCVELIPALKRYDIAKHAHELFDKRIPQTHEVKIGNREFKLNVIPVVMDGHSVLGLFVLQDVTEIQSLLANEKIINHCLEAFFAAKNAEKAIVKVLDAIREHMKATDALILRFDYETGFANVVAESGDKIGKELVSNKIPIDFEAEVMKRLVRGDHIYIDDASRPEHLREMPELEMAYRNNSLKSMYMKGIYINKKLRGFFALFYRDDQHVLTIREQNFLHHTISLIERLVIRDDDMRTLENALDAAEAAQRAKSYFIASVSHEIRTPLNAIIGFSELLAINDINAADRKAYLDSIVFSGNALLQLINDVLDLSKLEAAQMNIVPTPVNFRTLAEDTLKVFSMRSKEKELELKTDIGELPILELDKIRIRQILFNLLGNAIKFTEHGSITITGSFKYSTNDSGTFSFSVMDTGIGISSEDQEKLLLPFVQLSRTHSVNHTGTGLGLAICRQLAEKMGGKIWLESKPSHGSIFGITLENVKVAPVKPAEKKDMPEISSENLEHISLLLVDDVSLNLRVLEAMCRKIGFKDIVAVDTPFEAIKKFEERNFDILFTDMWMPQMNGAELARKIRNKEQFNNPQIVAITADIEAEDNFDISIFDGVLLKPVTLEKIHEILDVIKGTSKN